MNREANSKTTLEKVEQFNALNQSIFERDAAAAIQRTATRNCGEVTQFSTWLLAGSVGMNSFMIANAPYFVETLGKNGSLACGVILVLSSTIGLAACYFGLLCKACRSLDEGIEIALAPIIDHFDKHTEVAEEWAELHGHRIDSQVRMPRVLRRAFSPLPNIVKRRIHKYSRSTRHKIYSPRELAFRHFLALNILMHLQLATLVLGVGAATISAIGS